eukprot:36219-Chlamydomonas_euryale.AAC.1
MPDAHGAGHELCTRSCTFGGAEDDLKQTACLIAPSSQLLWGAYACMCVCGITTLDGSASAS